MKRELNIFEKLENKDICYAVCVAMTTFKSKGMDASGHDYFIIAELRYLEKLKHYKFKDNKNLSLKTIGLFTKILSLPPDWDLTVKGLVSICKDGESSIRNSVQELRKEKYLHKLILRDKNNRRVKTEYIVTEIPTNIPLGDFLQVESLLVELPVLLTTSSDQLLEKEINTKYSSSKSKIDRILYFFDIDLYFDSEITDKDIDSINIMTSKYGDLSELKASFEDRILNYYDMDIENREIWENCRLRNLFQLFTFYVNDEDRFNEIMTNNC